MKKKNMLLIIFAILLFFSFKSIVHGGTASFPSFGGGGSSDGKPPEKDYGVIHTDGDGTQYTCSFQYTLGYSDSITVDTYNKDNELTNANALSPKEKILSGTSIGVSIYEEKQVTWSVGKITVNRISPGSTKCAGRDFTETRCTDDCGGGNTSIGSIKILGKVCGEICIDVTKHCWNYSADNCPTWKGCYTYQSGGGSTPVTSGDRYTECQEKAETFLRESARKSMGPSYEVNLKNSNDIKKDDVTATLYGRTIDWQETSNSIYAKYGYAPTKVCMNVKTAAVSYKVGETKCDSNEIEVRNDGSDNHWHYFAPLNSKNADKFALTMKPTADAKKTAQQCINFMNSDKNYADWILSSDGQILSGDIDTDKEKVSNGCIVSSVITIVTDQKFYNETKDAVIEGYELFYRPINVNDPFPNGLSDDSYWKKFITSTSTSIVSVTNISNITKKYDLKDSFKEMTYSIYNINANAIRKYNHEDKNFYTSWENMKNDGTSLFVTQYNMRNNGKDFYKLGCGPANSSWEECRK